MGYLINRRKERTLVCFRRLTKPADLSDELEGRVPNLCVCGWWVEVEERFDISAHPQSLGIMRESRLVLG
jgi:hypothetical protein